MMTNADKIRSMTDDQLVDFMMMKFGICTEGGWRECDRPRGTNCKECFRSWIKSEVE